MASNAGTVKRTSVIYAIVALVGVAASACLSVLNANADELAIAGMARGFLVICASMGVATVAALSFPKTRRLAFGLPIIFFCFFQFFNLLTIGLSAGLSIGLATSVSAGVVLSSCALLAFVFSRIDAKPVLPWFALFLALSITVAGGRLVAQKRSLWEHSGEIEHAVASLTAPAELSGAPDKERLPDIIYIVPDRYGDERALRALFDAEESDFYRALDDRGFFRRADAHANYAKTFQSLASSLNMKDLQPITDTLAPISTSHLPVHRVIEDNSVQKTLRDAGYAFHFLGNWWEPSRRNRFADVNYYGLSQYEFSGVFWAAFSEAERVLILQTPLSVFLPRRAECRRLQRQLDYLQTVRERSKGPVFVFAHLTMPHDPITMNARGECIPEIQYDHRSRANLSSWLRFRDAYRDYLGYLNGRLIEIFDAAREASSRDMVFVIQSDEGPYPRKFRENIHMDMHLLTDTEIKVKFGIINALYWDAEKYGAPYLTRTPVNNWRIILSTVLGADLPLIEDERALLMRNDRDSYDLRDVTGIVATGAQPADVQPPDIQPGDAQLSTATESGEEEEASTAVLKETLHP